ncbi:hypothetical protein M407DRAFT_241019 [Tulasnella calospora MUT 4182]|uniref:Uncharacterized protein n=1 Tax=Tulasnella calospora MUT 4182 TaxID=1051891 RepID=A0A0C3MJ11_9AGAM|nr:hypothetical protein M407DRAFT_241019 [Tulasnella calospora MUT 4182]
MRSSFPSLFLTHHEVAKTPSHSRTIATQGTRTSSGRPLHPSTGASEPRPILGQQPSLARGNPYETASPLPTWTAPVTEPKVSGSPYFPSRESKGQSKLTFGNLPNRASVENQGSQRPRTSHGVRGRRTPVKERAPTPYPEARAGEGDYFQGTPAKSA